MLKISAKAVYTLLEKFYQRKSLNTFVYGDDMPDNVFESSKVFALGIEDYNYLSVMERDKDDLDAKYFFFLNPAVGELPFVFSKEKDFDLPEITALSINTTLIHKKFFEDIIEAQAESKGIEAQKCIDAFNSIRKSVEEVKLKMAEKAKAKKK